MPVSVSDLSVTSRLPWRYRLSEGGRSGLEAVEAPRVRVLEIHLVVVVVVGLAAVAVVFVVGRGLRVRGDALRGFSPLAPAHCGDLCVRARRGPLRPAEADGIGNKGRDTGRTSIESIAIRLVRKTKSLSCRGRRHCVTERCLRQ